MHLICTIVNITAIIACNPEYSTVENKTRALMGYYTRESWRVTFIRERNHHIKKMKKNNRGW